VRRDAHLKERHLRSDQLGMAADSRLAGRVASHPHSTLTMCPMWPRTGFRCTEATSRSPASVALRAFAPGYERVCVLMLEGVVSQLRDPRLILQTASVERLARRLERFISKHGPAINTLLELAVTESTPKTTNALEGKNGIFKPFSLIAKAFRLATGQNFFAVSRWWRTSMSRHVGRTKARVRSRVSTYFRP